MGQTFTNVGSVISFIDWINGVRTAAADEDGWTLLEFTLVGGSGSLMYDSEKRTRHRSTTFKSRMRTNEYTI